MLKDEGYGYVEMDFKGAARSPWVLAIGFRRAKISGKIPLVLRVENGKIMQ